MTVRHFRPRRLRAALRSFARGALVAAAIGACSRADASTYALTGGQAARGRDMIRSYGCGACHAIPGVIGARAKVGPPLDGFAGRSYIAGVRPNTPENLVRWIENPQAIDPRTAMPNMNVGLRDARDIAAYLYTLR